MFYNVFFWNSAILLYWLAYDVCRNVFFGFCTPLLLETRKLGLVKWQVLLRFCYVLSFMPLTSCYLDGSSFCLVSWWWLRCHNSMVWHKILSNKISLEFPVLFTIASLWKNLPDFRLLSVVIGYHNEYGLVKFQSSYWKRGLIGEISRIILCFFSMTVPHSFGRRNICSCLYYKLSSQTSFAWNMIFAGKKKGCLKHHAGTVCVHWFPTASNSTASRSILNNS